MICMRKLHRYIGLALWPLLCLMVVSGIALNHRDVLKELQLDRRWLPSAYHYKEWNQGFMKGALETEKQTWLLYGNEGIWLWKWPNKPIRYNNGLPLSGEQKRVIRVIKTNDNRFFALTPFALFQGKFDENHQVYWQKLALPQMKRLWMDMEIAGDTLVLITKSACFTSILDHQNRPIFKEQSLPDSHQRQRNASWFRVIWDLHAGAIGGLPGRLTVDLVGILFLFVGTTGLLLWAFKKRVKQLQKGKRKSTYRWIKYLFKWHDKWGYALLIPFVIITLTGIFLRPPFLLLVAHQSLPFSIQTPSHRIWEDKLRTIRWDKSREQWLIYTSDGMFATSSLDSKRTREMQKLNTPPISVMGLSVCEPAEADTWIIGSFSGLFRWYPHRGNFESVLPSPNSIRWMPSGIISANKIAGIVMGQHKPLIVFDYERGAESLEKWIHFAKMSSELTTLDMPLWQLALEIHTGRIFTHLGIFTLLVPFFIGIALLLILYSGWKVSK